ncbi:hypothetical protein M441DRAFT_409506 [Trichoderma asperellum CBS 433.97]|uniref:Uncharacterized protein n=1 Tax=Trichoderma asperellum (strain ATCC 204424 / CBS 433.97 / NBRC 101777) TaxID=1042311 RepID=A0A2T3Z720_TRIA4|nr:hypothetical protein M441DRAFT_409506 [Trichoderma asperellum CBS 433.97]PTB40631.1 hypothetical protein M441DRAFT_409506 [Trichoderma asperellum CBS 433.97]
MAPRLGALLTAPSSRPWTRTMPQAQAPRGRSRASSSSRVSPGPKSQARVPQMPPSHPLRGLVLEHAQILCAPGMGPAQVRFFKHPSPSGAEPVALAAPRWIVSESRTARSTPPSLPQQLWLLRHPFAACHTAH